VKEAVDYDPFAEATLERVLPSTAAQKEIWLAARMDEGALRAFNEPVVLRLTGRLDRRVLEGALQQTIEHHESLRASFSPLDGQLCVAQHVDFALGFLDLADCPAVEANRQLECARRDEAGAAFNLQHSPLLRARLVRLNADEHWLLLTAHHSVCDGWSMAVLLHDLACFYTAGIENRPADVEPAQSFSEYAHWLSARQTSSQRTRAFDYWLGRLAGELPALSLPTDRPHPPMITFASNRIDYRLPAELVQGLKQLGTRHKASFFTVLLGGWAAFLGRLACQSDLLIGIPAAGQAASGLTRVVGHCVNLLPMRFSISQEMSFRDVLEQVRRDLLDAYEHQDITLGDLLPHLTLKRSSGRRPVVSAAINLDRAIQGSTLPFIGLEVEFHSSPRPFDNAEIYLNAAETPGRLVLECQYNTDLWDEATIREHLESFEAFLDGAARAPTQSIASLPILSRAQEHRIFVDWNQTDVPVPAEKLANQLFEDQVAAGPERSALTWRQTTRSYRDLEVSANRLAHYLASRGVGRGSLVGLCMQRCLDVSVGMLAILKAGAAYVPLGANYPSERLAFMVQDAGLDCILTHANCKNLLGSRAAGAICVDEDAKAIATFPETRPLQAAGPDDPAYVIYTSGSTGKPKGVTLCHRGLVNILTHFARTPGLSADDVMPAVASLSFDMSVIDLLLPLTVGGRSVIVDEEITRDGPQLLKLLETAGATALLTTPATFRMLLRSGWTDHPRLACWSGGEALEPALAGALLAHGHRVWNLYGPTETTACSIGAEVTHSERIRIGRPVANTQAYVLDAHAQPVPPGVPGELYLGGAGVAVGYLNRPELTSERFVANRFRDPAIGSHGSRLYRTGDVARWSADGHLEYLGRNDYQVKLRGYRIELGEIEAALATHPGVRQAVAMVREDRPGDQRLVAYIISAPSRATVSEWRKHLRMRLPDYMVPQHFIELDSFPLSASGKIARDRLPPPFLAPLSQSSPRQPLTAAQGYVVHVCQEILKTSEVAAEDNFFQIGGHSLLAMQLLARLERETGVRLPPRSLMMNTLAKVAEALPAECVPAAFR
jgi:amino acid adenylation domain-containing protein